MEDRLSKFTKPIALILVGAAEAKRTITYGEIVARLRAEHFMGLDPRGIGTQLFAVHRLLMTDARARGFTSLPPLTAIATDKDGTPGNGLAQPIAEWLVASHAFPAMVRDAQAAAASGAALPPHCVRFAQTQVFGYRGWRKLLAALPDEAFAAASKG
jgi:hypothetical protein